MSSVDTSSLFSAAETKCASEVVYEQIYNKIKSGELKPGDRLPAERVLVDIFKRSRPVIREALRMLQQDGLIKIEVGSNGGSIIQGITIDSVEAPLQKLVDIGVISFRELVDYRAISDMGCAELAAKYRTDEDIEKLKDNIERYRLALGNYDEVNAIDLEFHAILSAATHNSLAQTVNNVVLRSVINLYLEVSASKIPAEQKAENCKKAYAHHKRLTDAIIAQDVETAKSAMCEIFDFFYNTVKEYIQG